MSEKSIGSYKVIRRIGEGGMAKVYLAVHRDVPNLKVVLKILSDPRLVERFRGEADKLALLDGHARICQIKHFFNHGEDIVIAMEYIDGQPLDKLLKNEGLLPFTESVRIISDVLETLDFAHQRGISHRDIKPGNVMIDSNKQVKIIDFGIAKAESDPNLTIDGSSCGTPTYMAPEQFNPTDRTDYVPADIYAVGTMLYYLLTGKLPFTGDNAFALRDAKLFSDPPPPREINSDIPESLQKIVLKALQKNPEDRYGSAREMRGAIQKINIEAPRQAAAERKTEHIQPGRKKGRGKLVPILAGLVVIVIAAYLIFTMGGGEDGPLTPKLFAPRSGMEIGTPRATFSWEATAGEGGSYSLEYSIDREFSNPRLIEEITTTTFTTADSLPDGQYFWRVKAIDQNGNGGEYSQVYAFNVVVPESVLARGQIAVTVTPSGDIYVDDSLYGQNKNRLTIPADTGMRIISVHNARSRQRKIVDTVYVKADETVTGSFRFTFPDAEPPKPQPATGDVRIGSSVGSMPVFGAVVYIDGREQPNKTPNTYTLSAGRHIIGVELAHEGRTLQKTDTIFVDKNGEHKLIFNFD